MDAPQIVPARPTHVGPLVSRMGAMALMGACGNARAEVRQHMRLSRECWVAELAGKPLAMWGVIAGSLATDGYVWFCVTEDARPYRRMFVADARRWIASLLEDGMLRTLHGYVVASDARAARYAEFLGFEVLGNETMGGVPARQIRMTR